MLCVIIVEGMSVVVNVMLSLMSVMSPPPALCNLSVRTAVKLCILGVSESVYVDLQYDEISFTFTAGPVCLCGFSSPVVVLGLFVRLS